MPVVKVLCSPRTQTLYPQTVAGRKDNFWGFHRAILGFHKAD